MQNGRDGVVSNRADRERHRSHWCDRNRDVRHVRRREIPDSPRILGPRSGRAIGCEIGRRVHFRQGCNRGVGNDLREKADFRSRAFHVLWHLGQRLYERSSVAGNASEDKVVSTVGSNAAAFSNAAQASIAQMATPRPADEQMPNLRVTLARTGARAVVVGCGESLRFRCRIVLRHSAALAIRGLASITHSVHRWR